jgi:glycine dehydrogenase
MALLYHASRHSKTNLVALGRRRRYFATIKPLTSLFSPLDTFPERHIGPDDKEVDYMLSKMGYNTMDAFVDATVPPKIRAPVTDVDNASIPPLSESQLHKRAKQLGASNKVVKSFIGMGYHNAVVPPVILRNVCAGCGVSILS